MSALDWVLSFVGLAGFGVFVGVIAVFVPEPALLAVIAIAFAMAVYDFWIRPLRRRKR